MNTPYTSASQLASDLKQKSLDSLFFTCTALLGYNKLTSHLHYEMCQVAQLSRVYKRLLCLVPRDHYKTTIDNIGLNVWTGLNWPDETTLVTCNTASNAEKIVGKVRDIFERAQLLRQLHPHLRAELSTRWNKKEACLPRTINHPEATWTPAGWDTRVTSGHWDHLLFDDIVDEETYQNSELMHKLIERFEQRTTGLLRPPVEESSVLVIMNHWSLIDLACHIIEIHPEYRIYYRQAIEGGKPIFPEMYSLEWLLQQQKLNPYNFANQWMNNPCDESVVENRIVDLQMYTRGDAEIILPPSADFPEGEEVPVQSLNIYAMVDPRHSISNTDAQRLTSRNAILVAGIDKRGRRYALDTYAKRSSPEELISKMYDMWQKWYPWGLIKMGVEGFGFQKALKPLSELIWKGKPNIPRLELRERNSKIVKETYIRGGYRVFAEKKGYSHPDLIEFTDEYLTFPRGRTRDLGDCWANLMDMMRAPLDEADAAAERAYDRKQLRSRHPMVGLP